MGKINLKSVSEEFMEKKQPQKLNNTITQILNNTNKLRRNIYISEDIWKILWQHRIDTGENISKTLERLTLENIAKKKQ